MKNDKYLIGDLSRLCKVSVRTINHYEEIALLEPDEIDSRTGYRYYKSEQLLKLGYIIWFKEQGFKLSEIKEMFDNGSYLPRIDKLEAILHKSEAELERLNRRCDNLRALITDRKKKGETPNIYLDKLPSAIVASCTVMLSDYDELKKFVMNVVGPEMFRLDCSSPHPFYCFSRETGKVSEDGKFEVEFCDEVVKMGKDSDIVKFKQLPEVPLAMCMKVYNPQRNLSVGRMALLAEIAKRGYRVAGDIRYNYLEGSWNQKNPRKWLTIIEVPVEVADVKDE